MIAKAPELLSGNFYHHKKSVAIMQRQIFIDRLGVENSSVGERACSPCHARLSCVNGYTLLA